MCSQGQSQHSYTEELSTFCSVQDLQTFTLYFYFLPLQLSSLTSAPLFTAEQHRDFWINPISTRPGKCKGVQVSAFPKGWVDLPWQLLCSIAKIRLVLCLGGSSMASTLSVSTADINRLFCVILISLGYCWLMLKAGGSRCPESLHWSLEAMLPAI